MNFSGFIGGLGTERSVKAGSETCINFYPESASANGRAALFATPGLSSALVTLSGVSINRVAALYASPSRNRVFAVGAAGGAATLYELTSSGTVATSRGSLSISPSFVLSTYTILENDTQLLIFDNSGASGNAPGSIFDLTTNTLSLISTAGGWNRNPQCGAYLDGYFIYARNNSNAFYVSNLNDGTTWNSTMFATTSDGPDIIMGMATLRRNLWIFGASRTSVYYDSGASDFPFARIPGAVLEIGCVSPGSVASTDDTILFVGSANGLNPSAPSVYMTEGYGAKRISTFAVEQTLATWGASSTYAGILTGCQSYVYQDRGHKFYILHPPYSMNGSGVVTPVTGATTVLVYDLTTGIWHERQYNAASPILGICHAATQYGDIVGAWSNASIYKMSTANTTDAGTAITRIRTAPHLSDENKFTSHSQFTLDCEAGVTTGSFSLSWSNDAGQTYNTPSSVSLPSGSTGARAIWRRLGKARDRVYKVTTSDSWAPTITGAFLETSAGNS
jgi:hypothetical protein